MMAWWDNWDKSSNDKYINYKLWELGKSAEFLLTKSSLPRRYYKSLAAKEIGPALEIISSCLGDFLTLEALKRSDSILPRATKNLALFSYLDRSRDQIDINPAILGEAEDGDIYHAMCRVQEICENRVANARKWAIGRTFVDVETAKDIRFVVDILNEHRKPIAYRLLQHVAADIVCVRLLEKEWISDPQKNLSAIVFLYSRRYGKKIF